MTTGLWGVTTICKLDTYSDKEKINPHSKETVEEGFWDIKNVNMVMNSYSARHLRFYVYSNLSNKIRFFSMAWQTFEELQHPWQSEYQAILIGGLQKDNKWPCTSIGIRVIVCQSLKDFIYYIEIEFSVTSNFDISELWFPLMYKVMFYLFGNL